MAEDTGQVQAAPPSASEASSGTGQATVAPPPSPSASEGIRWPDQDQASAPGAAPASAPDPDAPHREWVTKQDPEKLLETHEALRARVDEEANKRAQRAIARRDQELREWQSRHQEAEQARERREQEFAEVLSVLGGEFEPTEKYGKEAALQKLRQLSAPDMNSVAAQYAAAAKQQTRADDWGKDVPTEEFDAIFYESRSFGEMARKLAQANKWLSPADHEKAVKAEVEAARADERTRILGDQPNPESFRAAGGANGRPNGPLTAEGIRDLPQDEFKRQFDSGALWANLAPATANGRR